MKFIVPSTQSIKDFELRMENFAKRTAFAYDAVWSVALGLNATIAELGNDTDLKAFSPPPVTADHCGDFDSLNRDWEPGRSSYFGTLLRNKIFDAAFEGVSVSKHWKENEGGGGDEGWGGVEGGGEVGKGKREEGTILILILLRGM